jgi:hypothetical protein
MNSNSYQPALICPYTLMEEEALAWAILLFQQALLLHPYPLPLPDSIQPLADQGLIQVRSPERTREEIRKKDIQLRELKIYLADNPGRGFLKYLMEAAAQEKMETQEEIAGLMMGRTLIKSHSDSPLVSGPMLLCLIHEWMIQEREVETSLAAIEEQEKILAQSWQENPEEISIWKSADPRVLKRIEREINCPPALSAWWELKNALVPEPVPLFTTQPWVWAEHYGLDPEEGRINSISLPDLSSLNNGIFQNTKIHGPVREKMEAVLRLPLGIASRSAVDDFQIALLQLDLPPEGKYRLVFPPISSQLPVPPSSPAQSGSDPLILLLPATI